MLTQHVHVRWANNLLLQRCSFGSKFPVELYHEQAVVHLQLSLIIL